MRYVLAIAAAAALLAAAPPARAEKCLTILVTSHGNVVYCSNRPAP